jgi:hypothetical protein
LNSSRTMVHDRMQPLRLIEVAQAICDEMTNVSMNSAVLPYLPRMLIEECLPVKLAGFDWWEITEAADFLVRLGYMENPSGPLVSAVEANHHRR